MTADWYDLTNPPPSGIRCEELTPSKWPGFLERGWRVGFRHARGTALATGFTLLVAAGILVALAEGMEQRLETEHIWLRADQQRDHPWLLTGSRWLAGLLAVVAVLVGLRGYYGRVRIVVSREGVQIGRHNIAWLQLRDVRHIRFYLHGYGWVHWLLLRSGGRRRPFLVRNTLRCDLDHLAGWLDREVEPRAREQRSHGEV